MLYYANKSHDQLSLRQLWRKRYRNYLDDLLDYGHESKIYKHVHSKLKEIYGDRYKFSNSADSIVMRFGKNSIVYNISYQIYITNHKIEFRGYDVKMKGIPWGSATTDDIYDALYHYGKKSSTIHGEEIDKVASMICTLREHVANIFRNL